MKLLKKLIVLGVASTMLSGCGTMMLLSLDSETDHKKHVTYTPYKGTIGMLEDGITHSPIFLLDVPFSFVADTVVLPYGIYNLITK